MATTIQPSNTLVFTRPGRGAIAQLREQLVERGSRFAILNGAVKDFVGLRYDASGHGADGPEFLIDVDTIVIDEALRLNPEIRPLVQELLLERSLHGHTLPHLKNVVLVYSFIDKREAIEPFDMGTTYPTATLDI
ncbi:MULTISPECIES: hypothetical protein [unclassified Microbacterium]|uniref:hypothetical protein n=1 Tax=unclassified Microbacterium TaxID=2609290 RepID=UPI00288316B9|nr:MULTISPECIES: hypothetical protein [unclassified Microbacterium]